MGITQDAVLKFSTTRCHIFDKIQHYFIKGLDEICLERANNIVMATEFWDSPVCFPSAVWTKIPFLGNSINLIITFYTTYTTDLVFVAEDVGEIELSIAVVPR